ncbi:MAG: hypothetical protein IPL99_14760 [Candidatus Competibacteraceae bacterium]|nr:hypothetical protein [Candidatus Competibacteraceae bacterium]
MNPYSLLNEFSPTEAAQAITGIVQPKTPEENNTFTLTASSIHADIESEKLPATITEIPRIREERIGMRRTSIDDTRDHRPVIQHPYTERVIRIARSDLLTWCEQKGISPLLLFPNPEPVDKPVHQDEPSDYHTPALNALRAAITQFWLDHDPKRPPKSSEIVEWLIHNHDLTKTMAESIDRIIRPETHRKGGNVTRN